jgi:dTMP kinase
MDKGTTAASFILLLLLHPTIMSALSATSAKRRGAFILFEGIDRCGKSTQSKLLADYLATSPKRDGPVGGAELIRFPNRESCIGQLINSYLASTANMNDNTIHLLFSANRWEAHADMEAKLLSGRTLVCDRYCYSGVAFSAAKGMDFEWCKACDKGLLAPDCVIYLDMPVEEAAQRGNYGEERYEKIDFQRNVREKFMTLKKADEDGGKLPWYTLDARKSIEELKAEIQTIADKCVETAQVTELKRLW